MSNVNAHPRILFFGTPTFAVFSLQKLIQEGFCLTAVITQPDRPKGRGRSEIAPPVKIWAQNHTIPLLQPERVRDSSFLDTVTKMSPTLGIVAAFGRILPQDLLSIPRWGFINVHPSLLPKYRGAAPIQWTLIHGEEETGVTIMQMDRGMDTGDILLQQQIPVEPDETYGHLHDRLATLGADLLHQTLPRFLEGPVTGHPQDASAATYAPPLKREDARIDWDRNVHEITNLIRALSPSPGAFTRLRGRQCKIYGAVAEECQTGDNPGTIAAITAQGLAITAKNGVVWIQETQLEGKKRMTIHEFLRGCPVIRGEKLGQEDRSG